MIRFEVKVTQTAARDEARNTVGVSSPRGREVPAQPTLSLSLTEGASITKVGERTLAGPGLGSLASKLLTDTATRKARSKAGK